jgi:hypothetical protein
MDSEVYRDAMTMLQTTTGVSGTLLRALSKQIEEISEWYDAVAGPGSKIAFSGSFAVLCVGGETSYWMHGSTAARGDVGSYWFSWHQRIDRVSFRPQISF